MRGQAMRPHCNKCGHVDEVTVVGLKTESFSNGDKRYRARARCGSCGHEWFSIHPHLLRQAKATYL